MLATAFRTGLGAVRAAGLRAYALALLSYSPVLAVDATGHVVVAAVSLYLQLLVSLALIRLLGAYRPEPVPPPATVDAEGRRVLPPEKPGPPLGDADRRMGGALRNAFRLWRPGLSMTGLVLLAQVAALMTVVVLSGGRAADPEADLSILRLAVLPVSALFLAFVALAPQRIALEGESRVLVATAHSVRIARTAYAALLLVVVAEPLVMALGTLPVPDKDPAVMAVLPWTAAACAVAAVLQVVLTAVANELYLAGPRLDLPASPGVS